MKPYDPRWYPEGLYIHLPFCANLCTYCDFAREIYSKERTSRYLNALEAELQKKIPNLKNCIPQPSASLENKNIPLDGENFIQEKAMPSGTAPETFAPRTIFLGGGTPSALNLDELERLFAILGSCLDLSNLEEFTIEANPGSTDVTKLDLLLKHNVNRISFGVQSFRPHLLKLLGRIHGADQGVEAVAMARKAGFKNISIDLMHGLPGQSMDDLAYDLDQTLRLNLDHVSAYGLIYEHGTPLTEAVERKTIARLQPEQETEHYQLVMERMAGGGLPQYEISNYARPGREAQHNLIYWNAQAYLAAGVSAAQYVGGERITNIKDNEKYLQAIESNRDPGGYREVLEPKARAREALMLGLRLREGVHPETFFKRWGLAMEVEFSKTLKMFEVNALMEKTATGAWRITQTGMPLADGVLREFL